MKVTFLTVLLSLATFTSLAGQHALTPETMPQPLVPDARCQITSSTTDLDYGAKSRWEMQDMSDRSQSVTLGKRRISLSVVCPYTHNMSIKVMGDRNVRGGFRYGESGELQVRIVQAQLDGLDVQVGLSMPSGSLVGSPKDSLALLPEQTFSAVRGNQAVQGKAFIVLLEIQPVLTDTGARVSSRQTNTSNISFELVD
ncbi:hypothetical protein O8H67_000938 [Enterobacter asburiae]|nr:hypothetical protein [Enterobacter asburiae]